MEASAGLGGENKKKKPERRAGAGSGDLGGHAIKLHLTLKAQRVQWKDHSAQARKVD